MDIDVHMFFIIYIIIKYIFEIIYIYIFYYTEYL